MSAIPKKSLPAICIAEAVALDDSSNLSKILSISPKSADYSWLPPPQKLCNLSHYTMNLEVGKIRGGILPFASKVALHTNIDLVQEFADDATGRSTAQYTLGFENKPMG